MVFSESFKNLLKQRKPAAIATAVVTAAMTPVVLHGEKKVSNSQRLNELSTATEHWPIALANHMTLAITSTPWIDPNGNQRNHGDVNIFEPRIHDVITTQAASAAILACFLAFQPTITLQSGPLMVGIAIAVAMVKAEPLLVTKTEPKYSVDKANCCAPLVPQDILYAPAQQALQRIRHMTKHHLRREQSTFLSQLQSSGDETKATLTLVGFKGGSAKDQVNQDRAMVISPYLVPHTGNDLEAHRLLAIFDGHALYGEKVSEYCTQELPKLLARKISEGLDSEQSDEVQEQIIVKALKESFLELDRACPHGESGGCTATCVLQMGRKVYFANAGDSRSFLCVHHSRTNTTDVVYITREDKPDLPDERARVERMGGKVWIPSGPGGTARVLFTDPVSGDQTGIAMSRSIGDRDVGKFGVIPDPIVEVIDLEHLINDRLEQERSKKRGFLFNSEHEVVDDIHIFVVAASDGMMDILNPKGIARFLVPSLCDYDGEHLLTACEQLISTAADGWQRASVDGLYRDDIAISVSKLRTPPS